MPSCLRVRGHFFLRSALQGPAWKVSSLLPFHGLLGDEFGTIDPLLKPQARTIMKSTYPFNPVRNSLGQGHIIRNTGYLCRKPRLVLALCGLLLAFFSGISAAPAQSAGEILWSVDLAYTPVTA